MKFCFFTHSLRSDWNHGNAHFLRGVLSELVARGHQVRAFEPRDNWSTTHLRQEAQGENVLHSWENTYPLLRGVAQVYEAADEVRELVGDADVVIAHEWNEHSLIAQLGQLRREREFALLFHDTHHRAVTQRDAMAAYDLAHYDGVLAFGEVIRDLYQREKWARRAWTWHEAADTRVFVPHEGQERAGDLVWIGNWGDDERTQELQEFLLEPVRALGLQARIYGVRYPDEAREQLQKSGIDYAGWLPNFRAPEVFARFACTVHVPRRPYVAALSGIPTIRVFEALACGIPLISAPWHDSENLFAPGEDFWCARDGAEMQNQLRQLLHEPEHARAVAAHGLQTIRARHTCAHRVDELMLILNDL